MFQSIDVVRRALACGMRWIFRRPLVFLTSSVCLGVGIAACTVATILLDAIIFRPFGLSGTDRLVVIWEADASRGQDLIEVSHLNFLDWQRQVQTLESMAAFGSSHWPTLARIGTATIPVAARVVSVSFFSTLGVRPAYGRDISVEDLDATRPAPVMLSHQFWQDRFAGNVEVVGESIFLDGADHRIVGVMPRGFTYPDNPDIWRSAERVLGEALKAIPPDQQRFVGVLEVLARRRGHASAEDVRRELNGIVRSLREQYDPTGQRGSVVAVVNQFSDVLLGRLGTRLWIALGMAVVVMAFACANVVAVRLAHARERILELATRVFLGASRTRLTTELAVEALPLVGAAVLAAAVIASITIALLSGAPVVIENGRALLEHGKAGMVAAVILTILSWAIVGVLPAWVASRRSRVDVQLWSSRPPPRARAIGGPLLLGQAALAITVVAVAGAAFQIFDRLSRTDVGFATSGVTLVDITIPTWKYKDQVQRRALLTGIHHALRDVPGVVTVGAVSVRPFRFGEIVDGQPIRRSEDAHLEQTEAPAASRVVVTPDYFAALGVPIIEGRAFTDFDRADTEPVVIVTRTLARSLWGDAQAVGRRIETFSLRDKWRARLVVGVAGDARYRGLERPSLEVYMPDTQTALPPLSFVLRGHTESGIPASSIREAVGRVDPDVAIERVQTTRELVRSVLSPSRLLALLMSLLGGADLLLLAVGTFGAVATALRAAWPEIAVRQAVGAMPFQAARAPLRILARASTLGICIGLLLTPAALSAVEVLGLAPAGSLLLPVVAGVTAVVITSTGAALPLIWRTTRSSPAQLLREN